MLEELRDRLEEYGELAERRREELRRSLEGGEVADPLSATILGVTIGQMLLGAAISVGVSLGTSLLTRALTPRQKFTTGQLQGTLQVPQSDMGLPIVEGYGADPGARAEAFKPSHEYDLEERVVVDGYFYVVTAAGTSGASAPTFTQTKGAVVASGGVTFTCYGQTGGGFRLPMLIPWTSGIRKHETKTTGSGGGKGPKAPEQTTITYDLDLAVMPGRGPLRVKRIRANTKTIYQTYQNPTVFYQAESGSNTKTGGATNVTDSAASGGSAVEIPQNGSLRWNSVFGDGTAVILEFYLKTTATVTVQFEWTGAAGTTTFNDTISSTGGVYRFEYGSAPWALIDGTSNTVKVTNLSAASIFFDRLGVRVSGGPTGVISPDIPADEPYDPGLPADPNEPYLLPRSRFAGELLEDVDGSLSGVVRAGAGANIAIYPGNDTQLPDPTIEAAVDSQYGAGSTPAFRGRCLEVFKNFFLTDYGGAIPLIQTLAEHQTIDTFEALGEHLCGRTGVLLSTDYDWSGVRRIFLRGFPVTPPYSPADILEELARVYNVYFFEADKIYARERDSQAAVAALTSNDLGWVDGEEDEEEALPGLDASLATETEIARRYELTFVDPDKDFEQNSQGTSRQVTRSEKTEKIELALTMYPEEAREVTQRELYEEYVESTSYAGALDWSYLWVNPGDTVTVTEDDGFTHQIFITSLKPNVGVIPFEGFAEESAVYSQPVSTSGGGVFEIPPVPIPAMTVVSFYDGPALRTEDEGRAGFYVWAVKRAGDGDWSGAALYKMVEGEPQQVATFDTQAKAGKVVTKLGPVTDTDVEDTSRPFTVDTATDTITLTAHGFEEDETVGVSSSGTMPGGLSASALYYARNVTANTLQLALTPGGSAVDITSAGSGTRSVQRVIEVDLQDAEALLESVTADQIANGANPCLFGGEVVQVRTWELVAGYRRRFRGRDFTRGLRGSGPLAQSHVAGERFVSLDSAVKFIAQDIGELNAEREYRAVTSGQSLDDAAAVDFAWTGGTLKYPPPSIEATRDDETGDWRFLLYGVETTDPEGERYGLRVVGGRDFVLRGAASRPASLALTSRLGDDPAPPGKGIKRFYPATVPGNAVTAAAAFLLQLVTRERTAVSATYSTELTAADSPASNLTQLTFSPGGAFGLVLKVFARTDDDAGGLEVWDNLNLTPVYSDSAGEASGTRYSVEFLDGKVKFYRNRHVHAEAFYVYPVPAEILPDLFPLEVHASAATASTLAEIEVDDEGAAVVYTAEEQTDDFGSAQASLTVRASQQKVVQGVVVDGVITEVEFP